MPMNIFVLDKNPEKAARMLSDKHVIKMILESAQILCGVQILNNKQAPYKLTHKNHPCCIWTRESLSNYEWLMTHALALCNEYTRRYHRIHKSQEVILWCSSNHPNLEDCGLTPFAQAMPEQYKQKNVVKAYQAYYLNEKLYFARYTNCKAPRFLASKLKEYNEAKNQLIMENIQ
jgi:hypothetical protein